MTPVEPLERRGFDVVDVKLEGREVKLARNRTDRVDGRKRRAQINI
jgi:hypothetical protein